MANPSAPVKRRRGRMLLVGVGVVSALAAAAAVALATNHHDLYLRTVDQVRTTYGGSEAVPRAPTQADPRSVVAQSRLEEDPRLRMMWAGYAFSKDFREERGHAYMLTDQTLRHGPLRALQVVRVRPPADA